MILIGYYKFLATNIAKGGTVDVKLADGGNSTFAYYSAGYQLGWQNFSPRHLMQTVLTDKVSGGVVFGTGDKIPTISDYGLSGDKITTLTATVSSNYTQEETGISAETVYTLTNTSENEITVREVGLIAPRCTGSSFSGATSAGLMVERTVLDNPVTIPAGGVGQVTYTIRFNYPTA